MGRKHDVVDAEPRPRVGGPALSAVFAFSSSYAFLLIARSLQGIGSSCSSVAGRCGTNCEEVSVRGLPSVGGHTSIAS